MSTIVRELRGGRRLMADRRSFRRYAADVFLCRLLLPFPSLAQDRKRRITFRDGTVITYRLNRGDILAIREVWIDEVYRLPSHLAPRTVLDLGAHIGLASVWLAKRYPVSTIVAVEPSAANVALAEENLTSNAVSADVVAGAVGPEDGVAFFDEPPNSDGGIVGDRGIAVRVRSLASILDGLAPEAAIDLVKVDIEGGEGALFGSNLEWLDRVRAIVAEFHPRLVDRNEVIETLTWHGFEHVPSGRLHQFSSDCFVRPPAP